MELLGRRPVAELEIPQSVARNRLHGFCVPAQVPNLRGFVEGELGMAGPGLRGCAQGAPVRNQALEEIVPGSTGAQMKGASPEAEIKSNGRSRDDLKNPRMHKGYPHRIVRGARQTAALRSLSIFCLRISLNNRKRASCGNNLGHFDAFVVTAGNVPLAAWIRAKSNAPFPGKGVGTPVARTGLKGRKGREFGRAERRATTPRAAIPSHSG
jgi:hypothetical protein